MEASVYLDEEFLGKAAYQSLVSLSLFCEQQGYNIKWSNNGERVDIFSRKALETLIISSIYKSEKSQEVIKHLKDYLSNDGLDIKYIENKEQITLNPRLFIYIDVIESQQDIDPHIIVEHHSNMDERLKNILLTETNKGKLSIEFKQHHKNSLIISDNHLNVKCHLNQQSPVKTNISISLSRALTLYCHNQDSNKKRLFAYIPNAIMKNWLKSFMDSEHSTSIIPNEKVKIPKNELAESPASKLETAVQYNEINEAKAEIFLNYTLLMPRAEEQINEFMINGAIYMKNTGNKELKNPVICIKVPVEQGISLQGQIIPPRLVSGLALKSSGGDKGWKYVYEDWRDRVKTKGEYWITPIQDLQIPPGETQVFNGLKFAVKEPKINSSIIVQAFVYFSGGEYSFSSNNSISLSF